jgi:4-diphosphocytidyl-2-C-methyl-D-erythritol kinase
MHRLTIQVPGKVNLSLDVVGTRSDGYHLLSTVMQSISLSDHVSVFVSRQPSARTNIEVACSSPEVPLDDSNSARRAALLFLQETHPRFSTGWHFYIDLDKQIPVAAGLAGGSADAAGVLFGLNTLFQTPIDYDRLGNVSATLGADVPFCLHGGTAWCQGIGDEITPLRSWSNVPILLCCPDYAVFTRQVFSEFDRATPMTRPDTEAVLKAVREQDVDGLAHATANVLECVSRNGSVSLSMLKNTLYSEGAVLAQMSGSGPSVLGIFRSENIRDQAAIRLKKILPPSVRLFSCQTVSNGPVCV